MSLAIVIKSPEGVVLAAESRVTYMREEVVTDPQTGNPVIVRQPITFDNASKLLSFDSHNYVGAVTYDVAEIGSRTAHSFIPEFIAKIGHVGENEANRLTVKQFAKKLSDFFKEQWELANNSDSAGEGNNMRFIVGGFNKNEPYGEVYEVVIPGAPAPKLISSKEFGVWWGGQREIIDRIYNGIDAGFHARIEEVLELTDEQKQKIKDEQQNFILPVVPRVLALQDCVKLALTMIRTTIDLQTLAFAPRGVGGHIDIATITKEDGLHFVQRKQVNGERGSHV